ncbi:hypothetical protein BC349_18000 [Flavihumibacter stibioxidans]|uniref:Uncharacterized protein n=1 Tax=Flavihumibacter stibioxidans TaxID=1834163 RepID=A0ABR7MEL5_9BACT|nr:hypothetical protein [Flavihumibacter stibioxidans]
MKTKLANTGGWEWLILAEGIRNPGCWNLDLPPAKQTQTNQSLMIINKLSDTINIFPIYLVNPVFPH